MGKQKDYKSQRNLNESVSTMEPLKDTIVAVIAERAIQRAGHLSRQLLKAAPEQKEAVAAGIQIEKELANACRLSLKADPTAD